MWASSTADVRALQSPDQSTREAATYYDPNEIKLKLTSKKPTAAPCACTRSTGTPRAGGSSSRSTARARCSRATSAGRVGDLPDQRRGFRDGLDHGHLPGRSQRRAVGDLPGMSHWPGRGRGALKRRLALCARCERLGQLRRCSCSGRPPSALAEVARRLLTRCNARSYVKPTSLFGYLCVDRSQVTQTIGDGATPLLFGSTAACCRSAGGSARR